MKDLFLQKKFWVVGIGLLMLLLLIVTTLSAQEIQLTAHAKALMIKSEKHTLSQFEQKINSNLREVLKRMKQAGINRNNANARKVKETFSTPIINLDSSGRFLVTLRTREINSLLLSQLRNLEFDIVSTTENLNVTPNHQMISGWVPLDRIEDIARLSPIFHIRPADKPFVLTGDVNSAGDAILRADLARSTFGVDGSNQKIGVISDGIEHAANVQPPIGNDLPATIDIINNRFIGNAGNQDEGTAMLEIVHDLAPGADLAFADYGNSQTDFANNINLLQAAGCTIITDDIIYYLEPAYEDGVIAQTVDNVVNTNNVLYTSSAGNQQLDHYEGDYSDPNSNGWQNFLGGDETIDVELTGNRTIVVVLQWNNQFGNSGDDYDLYLYDDPPTNVLASSTTTQDGNDDPYEILDYANPSSNAITVHIAIDLYSGAARNLSVYTFGRGVTPQEYVGGDGTIFGHAAAQRCLTVGAIWALDPGNNDIEDFSSHGRPRIYSYDLIGNPISFVDRLKPDHAAIDGVQTKVGQLGFFSNPFFGTSAATPHTAAVAALVWDMDLSLTAIEVGDILNNTAVDLGTPGFDNVFGYGRIDAYNAIISLDDTPPSAPGTPTDAGLFSTSLDVTFNWTPAVDNESGIIDYQLQVGTSPGTNNVYDNWVGNFLTKTVTGSNGQTLYARVRAKNGAELIGVWSGNSDGITIDITPPSAPGTPTDDGAYTISRDVTFTWTPAMDNESGVVDYNLQVGTIPCGSDLFDDWVGNVLTYTVTGSAGQTLYAKARARNGAELIGDWSGCSDGITILPVDVVFGFNLAASMGNDIAEMKLAATTIINDLTGLSIDACFGVVSFVDYSGTYSSCDYSQQYGDELLGDYPWKVNQPLIPNTSIVQDTINVLQTFSGGDLPQNYTRALLECMFLNWRPDARKFVIMIGDAPAHDCDFFSTSYGADPGPDAKISTCDDLDYEKVVTWNDQAGLTVISIDNGNGTSATPDYEGDTWKNFEYMAVETGGQHFMKSNWHSIPLAIKNLVALGPKPVAAYPWIAEAEEMHNRNPLYGNPCANGWRLTHHDQPICDCVVYLTDGFYHFTVTAKAETAACAPPWLKVQIANEFSGTCEINSTEWDDYSFIVSLPAGFHCLSLTYMNDWWNQYIGDRNLLIDKVEITYQIGPLPTTAFTFEAEDMCQQNHTQLDPSGDYVILPRYYSYVGHYMFFEQPELDFEIIAKADFASGGWPEVELWIDSEIHSVVVDNASPISYLFHVSGITPGEHNVKIDFKNDSWASGRKLYIDKLIIHTVDGGLLKPEGDEPISDEKNVATIPDKFALSQNYPNPFNPETNIGFQLPEASHVVLKIFNLLGKEIKTLVNENKPAGYHTVQWDGRDNYGNKVVSGLYLYQIKAGNFSCIKKMALMK